MATVLLVGTLDTKREEYLWLKERLGALGADALLMDIGSFSESPEADISSHQVLEAAAASPEALRSTGDRGRTMTAMAQGAATLARELASQGKVHALLGVAGSGGSSVVAAAMQTLPIGFPKLLVSTMASGDVKPYIGQVDAAMMYSVVDVAGINHVSSLVFDNACTAVAAMARNQEQRSGNPDGGDHRPAVAITMFGVTTPAADEARRTLDELGYEPLVFHATGTGGQAMEKLVESGLVAGVVDLTTTELCDDLVGGILSAGPNRLEMAGRMGVPQVVSVGALDMVNFGPMESVPKRFRSRNLLVHNPTVTLLRTTPEEMAELGRRIARKLSAATGPTQLFLPLRGVSAVDIEGGPFRDEQADAELFEQLRQGLAASNVTIIERDENINTPGFGEAMARALHTLITNNA